MDLTVWKFSQGESLIIAIVQFQSSLDVRDAHPTSFVLRCGRLNETTA